MVIDSYKQIICLGEIIGKLPELLEYLLELFLTAVSITSCKIKKKYIYDYYEFKCATRSRTDLMHLSES